MFRATLCALLVLATTPLGAQERKQPQGPGQVQTDVALALVLAVDASGSVSDERFELQKQGYAAAFRKVLNSIRSLATKSIAVAMMQWTGPKLHVQTVEWTLAKDEASVNALAIRLKRRSGNCSAAAPRLVVRSIIRASSSPPVRFSASVAASTSRATVLTIADER